MSTINIEVTKNVYDVDLQQNVTSYDVTLEKGYYPLPGGGGGDLSNYYKKSETYSKIEIDELLDSIKVTKTELDVLISENKLDPNRLYKITGVESWCFSQYLIKAIYLKAITNNTLELEGVGEFYTPKYNTSDSNLGIWKGELLANGMIDSLSYNIGDKVIWGNLFWENISGNIGTNEKEVEGLGSLKIDNYLSEVDWQLITPNDDESLYNIQFDAIKYDIENDYINYRADDLGNVYEITYNRLLTVHPNYNLAITEDPTFIYYLNAISLFQWGRNNVYSNIINESFVQNCNYNPTAFYDNTFESSRMHENNFLNVSIIGNSVKNAYIVSNYLKTYGGILYNNLENSNISSNKYYFEISYNNLKYNSSIYNNNDNNIIVGTNYSRIKGNNLDNNSTISNNIFVEEGNGVSGYKKGIYGNVLITYCNINSNTIKNGSRIYDHTMDYYSTINNNSLDTDSNIYNNQVIQNGKINNNILTGHGRIYGNQLDRVSEITLCKLRIFPATSYATTMKSNRLFAGKIQNVDFGNIVNPVGTNPNDPAFGGNELSNSIIENGSIIKDLTFPNHGGVGLQFIKMNGYSEFKNITVNDSIRNVDFINTIFNEISDYSKLIEGSGYQTNGFTKTYIDGVLLQDRFDNKQDVLTEDNVGQFMDLELPTKLTPTSGDTVLGRDSVTGKAVEIPTSSLGGGGSSLALGETASTAYRGDRGKTAYDHSQTTGNPHNTKVEELTDVGSETNSIEDTDVILKKEVIGGFWRKITWTNIKSALKTYFDSLYAPKSFNVKVTTPSSWVTGTLSETEVYRFSIPANTISSESILSIESMLFNKIGVNGFFQVRVKLTTSATMPTGSTEQIARSPNVSANTRAVAIRRKFYVNGDVIKSQGFDSGLYFDEINNTDVISTRTLDRTQTYNVIISVTLNNASDQVRLEGLDFNIK